MWYYDYDDDYDYDYYPNYEKTTPRQVQGGIKLQSGSSSKKNWWYQKWIKALESFTISSRLTRGRSYAKKGQVVSISIEKNQVKAKVQGSAPNPYTVTISLTPISPSQWEKVLRAISQEAIYIARLMAGEMPQDIEKIFEKTGVSLFPKGKKDIQTRCSCPDSANPCKHISAVYYILGEEFDRDPFLTFQLRGLGKKELLERMDVSSSSQEEKKVVKEDLPSDLSHFWRGEELAENFVENVTSPPVKAALLKRLGTFPLWKGSTKILDSLLPVYQSAMRFKQ